MRASRICEMAADAPASLFLLHSARGPLPDNHDGDDHVELPQRHRLLGAAEADGDGGRGEHAVREVPAEDGGVAVDLPPPLAGAPRVRRPDDRLSVGPFCVPAIAARTAGSAAPLPHRRLRRIPRSGARARARQRRGAGRHS